MISFTNISDEDPTPELLYTTMVSDIRQTCPVNEFTGMISSISSSPVFRYIITSRPSSAVSLIHFLYKSLTNIAFFSHFEMNAFNVF